MKKGCWNDKEVIDLFAVVENVREENKPLKSAFMRHAEKYRRKPNSVRNYYYFELEELKKDIVKTKRLGINLSLHEKVEFDYFSQEEEDKLVKEIDALIANGYSLRRACLKLSDGDISKMLRYQNKYRACKAKSKKDELPNNIITFTKKKKEFLSESDINSLFLGLVRLVKRSAMEEISFKSKQEKENTNNALRQALVDLNKKDKELEKLKDDFLKLKLENSRLVQNMMKMQCEKAEKLSKIKAANKGIVEV